MAEQLGSSSSLCSHLAKPEIVVKTTVGLGYAETAILPLGIVLLACTILYLIPQTAVRGAILLTGYLGGAVATQVRAGQGLFRILFPVVLGIQLWGGLVFREARLRACSVAELGRAAYRHQSDLII